MHGMKKKLCRVGKKHGKQWKLERYTIHTYVVMADILVGYLHQKMVGANAAPLRLFPTVPNPGRAGNFSALLDTGGRFPRDATTA